MKATVNENCIGCGLCESICPAVFKIVDSGVAQAVGTVDDESEALAKEARDQCPVEAIELV